MPDDETFLQQFEAGTWPLESMHHREHVKLAYLYLCRYPSEEATRRIRSSIKRFNAAHNVPEGPDRGYHETMTQAWMRLIFCALTEFGPAENSDAFVDKHTQLPAKRALLFFYSRDHIMSAEAKQRLVEPDLSPLPESQKTPQAWK
ncbi:MAG: hypothetical protein ACREE6_01140 [Limisphaerales bacterium]